MLYILDYSKIIFIPQMVNFCGIFIYFLILIIKEGFIMSRVIYSEKANKVLIDELGRTINWRIKMEGKF